VLSTKFEVLVMCQIINSQAVNVKRLTEERLTLTELHCHR